MNSVKIGVRGETAKPPDHVVLLVEAKGTSSRSDHILAVQLLQNAEDYGLARAFDSSVRLLGFIQLLQRGLVHSLGLRPDFFQYLTLSREFIGRGSGTDVGAQLF